MKVNSIFLGNRIEAFELLNKLTNIKAVYTNKHSYIYKRYNNNKKFKLLIIDHFKKNQLFREIFNTNVRLIISVGFVYKIPKEYIKKKIYNIKFTS